MPIVLNGTTGITNDSGYTGDGVSFADSTPANTLVTTSGGNVGMGTSSPTFKVEAIGSAPAFFGENSTNGTQFGYRATMPSNTTNCFVGWVSDAVAGINGDLALCPRTSAGARILFFTGSTTPSERMRIDSSGNLLVGTTSASFSARTNINAGSVNGLSITSASTYTGLIVSVPTSGSTLADWRFNNTQVGLIATNGSSTTYSTSSDYRLKENIQPMTGALAKVAALKPCTYTWKSTGEADEGFIAHELQEVCPSAVTGEKDAVDAEGNPQYQGIDTSFLVATLTAAIQEQQALIESLTARVVALDARLTSLEGQAT